MQVVEMDTHHPYSSKWIILKRGECQMCICKDGAATWELRTLDPCSGRRSSGRVPGSALLVVIPHFHAATRHKVITFVPSSRKNGRTQISLHAGRFPLHAGAWKTRDFLLASCPLRCISAGVSHEHKLTCFIPPCLSSQRIAMRQGEHLWKALECPWSSNGPEDASQDGRGLGAKY